MSTNNAPCAACGIRGRLFEIHDGPEATRLRCCSACVTSKAGVILADTLRDTGLTVAELGNRPGRKVNKTAPFTAARYACFETLRAEGWSTEAIAEPFGMSHSTVVLALKKLAAPTVPAVQSRT